MELKDSITKENLMRAFAGESQARNRYTIAASQAHREHMAALEAVFLFTANQEREHAEIFYKHLSPLAQHNISIDGNYPVDISGDIAQLLRFAEKNEMEEHDDVYRAFEEKAREEGFQDIAGSFHMIGEIEKIHGKRFGMLAELLEEKKLFVSEVETSWICLKCGHVIQGCRCRKNARCAVTTEDIISVWNYCHVRWEIHFRRFCKPCFL